MFDLRPLFLLLQLLFLLRKKCGVPPWWPSIELEPPGRVHCPVHLTLANFQAPAEASGLTPGSNHKGPLVCSPPGASCVHENVRMQGVQGEPLEPSMSPLGE